METENTTENTTETTPETPQVETPQAETPQAESTQRVRTTDEKFFEVCEEVAKSDSPTIKAVSERLGITPASVTQRRNAFNAQYRDLGLVLTPFPRGGGQKKDVNAIAAKLLAMRAAASESESESPETTEAAE